MCLGIKQTYYLPRDRHIITLITHFAETTLLMAKPIIQHDDEKLYVPTFIYLHDKVIITLICISKCHSDVKIHDIHLITFNTEMPYIISNIHVFMKFKKIAYVELHQTLNL